MRSFKKGFRAPLNGLEGDPCKKDMAISVNRGGAFANNLGPSLGVLLD